MSKNAKLWLLWLLIAVPATVFVFATMVYGGPRSFLLIGETTSGHHQIELACDACHGGLFSDEDVMQDACVTCHGTELKQANDSHPKAKFTDPRNADRTAKLDARYCVTCHREHKPEITQAMGVTLPDDYCFVCHEDIAKDRPSHKDLPFDGCASSGCHNFHDNRALYEDFLAKYQDQPAQLPVQRIAFWDWEPTPAEGVTPLSLDDADAPSAHAGDAAVLAAWAGDAHAENGVNCKGCHTVKTRPDDWIERPDETACTRCHEGERASFGQGKHGIRLEDDLLVEHDGAFGLFTEEALSPMRPALARLPMKADAHDRELGCNSCHGAHDYDTEKAQVDACLSCHDDEHSLAYKASPHGRLWQAERGQAEREGKTVDGTGVTCATCHMPRIQEQDAYGRTQIFATHNQNATLQPNEKMIRPVCLSCHGLGFAIDALADPALVRSNFFGPPRSHVPSLEWVAERIKAKGGTVESGGSDAPGS